MSAKQEMLKQLRARKEAREAKARAAQEEAVKAGKGTEEEEEDGLPMTTSTEAEAPEETPEEAAQDEPGDIPFSEDEENAPTPTKAEPEDSPTPTPPEKEEGTSDKGKRKRRTKKEMEAAKAAEAAEIAEKLGVSSGFSQEQMEEFCKTFAEAAGDIAEALVAKAATNVIYVGPDGEERDVKEGKVLVNRHYSEKGVLIEEDQTQEAFRVGIFDSPPAHVTVGLGSTMNLGDFNSYKVEVRVSVPCYLEEIDRAMEFASAKAQERLEQETSSDEDDE
jgi:hypothetical protein